MPLMDRNSPCFWINIHHTLQTQIKLNKTKNLRGVYPNFTDQESESLRGEVKGKTSQTREGQSLSFITLSHWVMSQMEFF